MTATLTRRPALTEVLPSHAPKAKPGAIRFTPGHRPGTGLVTVQAGRSGAAADAPPVGRGGPSVGQVRGG